MSITITAVKPSDDNEKVDLFFDDGSKLTLTAYDWYGLSVGHSEGEISDEDYELLVKCDELGRAKNKLLSLLGYAGNSEKGYAQKLKRYGFSDESIAAAIDFAVDKKLICDEDYAAFLAHELVEVKLYGPIRVKQEMFRHGIDAALGKAVTAQYDVPDADGLSVYDRNMYKTAVAKAKNTDLCDKGQREKLFAALNRAGYEYSRISKLKFRKK